MIRTWRLDSPAQTLALTSFDGRLPEVVYWSAPLPLDEDIEALALVTRRAAAGGMLDTIPELSICPEAAAGFPGQPGLVLSEGPMALSFHKDQSRANALSLVYRDEADTIRFRFEAEVDPETDVIALSNSILLKREGRIRVDWLSAPVLPAPESGEIIEFSGRWCGEFQTNRIPWSPGARLRESSLGRTSHEHFPGLLMPTQGATETIGEAFGLHFAWCGGHRMIAEELPDGRRQIQFGHASQTGGVNVRGLKVGPLYATRSGAGLNGVSQAFHAHLRRNILNFPDPARPRPVHYNCWEAVYFDHDLATLISLADKAAAFGVERFVLDDGWFGRRDDDTSSLGDWAVDTRKYPDGLAPLIDHASGLGMGFGIWVEPEMANPDSDLLRAHPDWVLGPADQPLARHQLVLDLRRQEVRDHLFERLDALLSAHAIEYLKWDHNRPHPFADIAQTDGFFALLERLRAAHPGVEIETCSSGGGRVDFGILKHTHRFWPSDSNDARERWRIQRGASYFFPPEIIGAHVGPRICHTSGRQLSMAYRCAVAGTRAMGVEMDLRELTDAEAAALTAAIAVFKIRRELLHTGRLHRLDSADPEMLAEMHAAEDGSEFILFCGQMDPSAQQTARPLRLTGLDPAGRYALRLENADAKHPAWNKPTANPLANGAAVTLSGAALMAGGIALPNAMPETIWTVTGRRIDP